MEKIKILVVDDESRMRKLVKDFLGREGYQVLEAGDGLEAMEAFYAEKDIALIILDVMMPKMNGIDVLRRLRAEGIKTPVMMLTAKGMKDDRITGFNAGADDYLPKPFEPDELICRVRAMLRRSDNYRPSALEFGDVTLDPSTGLLACSGRSVRLSGREYQVMELFMRSPNIVFSADKIRERGWGWDSEAEIIVIWMHISNLRKKLRSIGSKITIRAVRGLGYALEESDD